MHDVLFDIFGYKVYSFSAMLVIGVFSLAILYMWGLNRREIPSKHYDRLIIITAIAGIFTYLGASFFDSLWHCIGQAMVDGKFHPDRFTFSTNLGGITFEGGIFTGLIAFALLLPIGVKSEKRYPLFYMDIAVPGILLAHFFGRIGCFLAGCCYGKHTDSIFGIHYPTDDGWMKVFPTQLYEACFLLICFVIFFFFVKKYIIEKYLISYGVFRFFLEFLRGDNRGKFIIPFLTPSQFMSIVFILLGVAFFFLRKKLYNDSLKDYENREQNNLKLPTKRIRYYECNYKFFFKILFNKKVCPDCGKNMKLGLSSKVSPENKIELHKYDHMAYKCKCGCIKDYEKSTF